jgi:hypothetical protein
MQLSDAILWRKQQDKMEELRKEVDAMFDIRDKFFLTNRECTLAHARSFHVCMANA